MRPGNAVRRDSAIPFIIASLASLALPAKADTPAQGTPSASLDVGLTTGGTRPPSDAELGANVNRSTVERAAMARNAALQAAEHRVRAITEEARSEGGLPEPEFMAWVWQVPISRPYAFGDAGMIMLGLTQSFPAPGSLGFKEDAKVHEARAEAAMVISRARDLLRTVDHTFVDYAEAKSRHAVHLEHREVMQRMAGLARARYAAAGNLAEAAQAEAELARLEAEVATDHSAIEIARARLNGLLSRDAEAPLGEPIPEAPAGIGLTAREIVARAQANRPEVRAADEKREQMGAEARAANREGMLPSFSVSALYFAPVGPMPTNGWGAQFSMSLPWLWGARSHRAGAGREMLEAERGDAQDAKVRAGADAAGSTAAALGAERRYSLLHDRALPASQRAAEAARTGYVSGRSDLMAVLLADRSVVDIQMDIIMAHSALDHALVDLDWAAGGRLPRRPLQSSEGTENVQ